jgi:hypothetical protein
MIESILENIVSTTISGFVAGCPASYIRGYRVEPLFQSRFQNSLLLFRKVHRVGLFLVSTTYLPTYLPTYLLYLYITPPLGPLTCPSSIQLSIEPWAWDLLQVPRYHVVVTRQAQHVRYIHVPKLRSAPSKIGTTYVCSKAMMHGSRQRTVPYSTLSTLHCSHSTHYSRRMKIFRFPALLNTTGGPPFSYYSTYFFIFFPRL